MRRQKGKMLTHLSKSRTPNGRMRRQKGKTLTHLRKSRTPNGKMLTHLRRSRTHFSNFYIENDALSKKS